MHIKNLDVEEWGDSTRVATPYDADIIILSFNRLNHTLAAIKSALSQKSVNARIALLDQGSSQETLTTLKDEIRTFPTVRLFTTSNNLGVGGGRNFLSSIGTGRIIVGLDNDAVFADDYVVHNTLRLFDEEARLGALGFYILSGDGSQIDDLSWGYPNLLRSRCNERFLTTTYVGAGHALRRKTWEEAGGYDASLFFTWEEYDFCLRAIALKWNIMYDGSLRVHHNTASEQRVGWSNGRRRMFVRNRLIIGRKWGHNWLTLLPRIIAYTINGATNGHLGSTLSGIIDAIRQDKNTPKQNTTAHMRDYLFINETRYRGSLCRRFRMEILKPLQASSSSHLVPFERG
jgi:GT2 family glycosyltransferase